MRTIVDVPEDQLSALAALCEREKISRAEAVRRALASMLAIENETGRESAFGAWKQKKVDASAYVREIREEWER